jgi:hypothetical protein
MPLARTSSFVLRLAVAVTVLVAVALIVLGFIVWRSTPEYTVFEQDSGKVFIASDIESFEALLAASPSPTWAQAVRIPELSQRISGRTAANKLVSEFVRMGRILAVSSGRPVQVVDRAEYHGGAFEPRTPSSYRSRREEMRVQVVRVQLKSDGLLPIDGWTLEALVRTQSAPWP